MCDVFFYLDNHFNHVLYDEYTNQREDFINQIQYARINVMPRCIFFFYTKKKICRNVLTYSID